MSPARLHNESSTLVEPATTCCPICTGPMCDLGGTQRCTRCQFTFCPTCEGRSTDADADSASRRDG